MTFIVPRTFECPTCHDRVSWSPSYGGIAATNIAGLPRPICSSCLNKWLQSQGWVMEAVD